MSDKQVSGLRAIEGQNLPLDIDEQNALASIFTAWFIRNEGNDLTIEERLTRISNGSSGREVSVFVHSASAIVEGYVALIALEHMPEQTEQISHYRIGQRAVAQYFEASFIQRQTAVLDEVILVASSAYDDHDLPSRKVRPDLRLITTPPETVREPRAGERSQVRILRTVDGELAKVLDQEVGSSDREAIARLLSHPILSRETRNELIVRAKGGDKDAREMIVRHTMRWVAKRAAKKLYNGVSFEDLLQEGAMGVDHALTKFDETKGFEFITYATRWIDQRMSRAIKKQASTIRLPDEVRDHNMKIKKAEDKFVQTNWRNPSRQELADITGFSEQYISDIKRALYTESLDEPVSNDSHSDNLGELIEDPEQDVAGDAINSAALSEIVLVIDKLPPDAAKAIKLRYGLIDGIEHTYKDIGNEIGINRDAVRRKILTALDEIKLILEDTSTPETSESLNSLSQSTEGRNLAKRGRPISRKAPTRKPIPSNPGQTPEQTRLGSLELANESRTAPARLKQQLRKNEISLSDALTNEAANKIKIGKLLKCVAGVGDVRIKKILKEANIHLRTEVGALTGDERRLISNLTPRPRIKNTSAQQNTISAKKIQVLEQARMVRLQMAEIKKDLKSHEMSLEDVFSETIGLSMKLIDVLHGLPTATTSTGTHKMAAETIMEEADLPPDIKCRDLTDNKRSILFGILKNRGFI
jgi:RNA polymerase sigma factor (sigma-70 family)